VKIAVIGSTMMDLVSYTDKIPAAGETCESEEFHIACGGKGANQAIAAGKLGADVLMLTSVGDDLFGEQARKNFAEHHVDTKYVRTAKDTMNGVATILVDASSQNRILIHKGANDRLTPAMIAAAGNDLKQCGLFVLQLEVPLETVYAAIIFARENHIPVLLNPAPAVKELSIEMVCQCDFFVPNETELAALTRMPTNSLDEIRKAAAQLVSQGMKNVIVTMGDKGVLWLNGNQQELVPAKHVTAVDTTGAGDAFIGCFAACYTSTGDIRQSLQEASLYAALSVTKKGTQDSYASYAEFKSFAAEKI
jgi:ribokinase